MILTPTPIYNRKESIVTLFEFIRAALIIMALAGNFWAGFKAVQIVKNNPELKARVWESDYVLYVIFGVGFLLMAAIQRNKLYQPRRAEG